MSKPLPLYQCHKQVRALKIERVVELEHGVELHFVEDYRHITVDQPWYDKHVPLAGGYYVVYEDSYSSFSPAAAFEGGYTLVPETTS